MYHMRRRIHVCQLRRRIHVSYEEEDTCVREHLARKKIGGLLYYQAPPRPREEFLCVCVCVRARVRACVRACA